MIGLHNSFRLAATIPQTFYSYKNCSMIQTDCFLEKYVVKLMSTKWWKAHGRIEWDAFENIVIHKHCQLYDNKDSPKASPFNRLFSHNSQQALKKLWPVPLYKKFSCYPASVGENKGLNILENQSQCNDDSLKSIVIFHKLWRWC